MKRGPRISYESIEIRTSSGVALRATVQEPPSRARGTAVLAHAEFASRRDWDGSSGRGLAHSLVSQRWRTVAFDFRGHGDSRDRETDFTYDDLVRDDLPTVTACARDRWSGPLVVVGHALGGHVAMAGCGTRVVDADAIVAIAANVWLPQFEPSALRWRAKRAAATFIATVVQARGYFPARALGLGTEDAPAGLMRAAVRAVRDGTWRSEDGTLDYERALGEVRVPVLSVASTRDRLLCAPECAERMLARCAGQKDFRVIARDDVGGPAPGHRELVTGRDSEEVWKTIAHWLDETVST